MKPAAKWILGGCAVLCFLAIVVALAGLIWMWANQDRFKEQAKQLRDDGVEAGRSRTESECVDQALARYADSESMVGAIREGVWMRGCLESSRYEPAFCQGVPSKEEILATTSWRLRRCEEAGFEGKSNCHNILGQVQEYCESRERAEKR